MKKIFLLLILGIFLISFISANTQLTSYPYSATISSPQVNSTSKTGGLILTSFNSSWISYALVTITKFGNCSATVAYLIDNSTGNTLNSSSFVGNDASVSYPLSNNTYYRIVVDKGGASFSQGTTWAATNMNILSNEIYWKGGFANDGVYNANAVYGVYSINYSISKREFVENSQTYNSSTYETSSENFEINITYNNSFYTSVSANLNYNGVSYSGTKSGTGNTSIFDKSIIISTGTANNTFYWTISLTNSSGTFQFNSTFNNQTVNTAMFGICNSTLNVSYINFTFQDEINLTTLNSTISASSFNYWIGDGSITKSLSYSNSTSHFNYAFCFSPTNKQIGINYSISYESSGYPTRSYTSPTTTITNTTTNKTLYLLPLSSGQVVTFQVVNPAQQPISGVIGNATRTISGTTTLIGSGVSGSDGGISFFVDPLLSYTFSFSKTGYNVYTFTTTPTQTQYTITLGGSTTTSNDYTRGITQTIQPSNDILINNTIYNFNYTISSSYWNLDSFGFTIFGNSTYLLSTQSSTTSSGGIVSDNINTDNYTTITMKYYYVINGTYVNSSIQWYVQNINGNEYSINNLANDFKTYLTLGMFGATNFAVGIIVFIVMFVFVGITTSKFGFGSLASTLAIVAGVVVFFDVGLNFDSYLNPLPTAVPYLPSIIVLFIAVGEIWRETTR